MAWRFQPSKFKNTTPKLPKKEDTLFDLPIGTLSCTNNGIQSSANFLAFCIEGEGGKLGTCPIGSKGRHLRKDLNVVCAHSEMIDDFSFMRFNDNLLLTCCRDEKMKLWRLSSEGSRPVLEREIDLGNGKFLGSLCPHTTASGLVAYTSTSSTTVVDWEAQRTVYELEGIVDKGLSCTWSEDGRLLAANCDKGRIGLVWDVRAGCHPIQTFELHKGLGREARVLFAGDRLISSGFTHMRVQEVNIFDITKWGTPVHTAEFTATTGVLIPLYDPDTKLVFLAGKGTNKLILHELQTRQPIMSPVFEMPLPDQVLGGCLGNKRSVNVMEGEVQTFYQLSKHSILPIPCIVPRRSYRDFHSDLFPDTVGVAAGCTAEQWKNGSDTKPAKISLCPDSGEHVSSRSIHTNTITPSSTVLQTFIPLEPIQEVPKPISGAGKPNDLKYASDTISETALTVPTYTESENVIPLNAEKMVNEEMPIEKLGSREQSPSVEKENILNEVATKMEEPVENLQSIRIRQMGTKLPEKRPMSSVNRSRPKSCVVGQVASKFRHVETLAGIKANNAVFSNLRNVNTRLPPETNGICASSRWIALPLSGPAGIICILDVNEPCKLPDGVMDGLFNKAQVTDLQWNPFNDSELAVGTDVGVINLWTVSKEDKQRNEMEPSQIIKLGGEKIVCMRWHPLASDLMAVALSDCSVELWNLRTSTRLQRIDAHEIGILSIAWSADGKRLVTAGKDLMIKIFAPRLEMNCLVVSKCLESPRSARVLYVCDDRLILAVGLTKSSVRTVTLLDASNLQMVHTQVINNAVQPLVPHYDFDSSVLFLSAKGERYVHMFEVCFDSPYLLPLSDYQANSGHQAIAYHNKTRCNVMAVEFQRGWRLTDKSLEQLIFRVPRVKKDVFQSDLFPDALVTWQPACTCDEWLSGADVIPLFQNLKPDGVGALAMDSSVSVSRLVKISHFNLNEEKLHQEHKHAPDLEKSFDKKTVTEKAIVSECPFGVEHTYPMKVKEQKEMEKEIEVSLSEKISIDTRLEQDHMEGVAEEEWIE